MSILRKIGRVLLVIGAVLLGFVLGVNLHEQCLIGHAVWESLFQYAPASLAGVAWTFFFVPFALGIGGAIYLESKRRARFAVGMSCGALLVTALITQVACIAIHSIHPRVDFGFLKRHALNWPACPIGLWGDRKGFTVFQAPVDVVETSAAKELQALGYYRGSKTDHDWTSRPAYQEGMVRSVLFLPGRFTLLTPGGDDWDVTTDDDPRFSTVVIYEPDTLPELVRAFVL